MRTSMGPRLLHARPVTLFAMVLAAALFRVVPHPPNLTPIGGMALFAGAHFAGRIAALTVPLAAMFLSDAMLEALGGQGFHSGMVPVYACFAAAVLLGRRLQEHRRALPLLASTLACAALFFIVTNFAVWVSDHQYPRDLAGLAACYITGLPFFGNTLAGDLLTASVLFGSFAWAERRWPALRVTPLHSGSR